MKGMIDSWPPALTNSGGISEPSPLSDLIRNATGRTESSSTSVAEGNSDSDDSDESDDDDKKQQNLALGGPGESDSTTDAFAFLDDTEDPAAEEEEEDFVASAPIQSKSIGEISKSIGEQVTAENEDEDALEQQFKEKFGGESLKMMRRGSKNKGKRQGRSLMAGLFGDEGSGRSDPSTDALSALYSQDISSETDSVPDNVGLSLESPPTVGGGKKSWKVAAELQGHLNGVRQAVFHPALPQLVSVSEDCTAKMWQLDPALLEPNRMKKGRSTALEPVVTFRGHTGPVLAAVIAPETSLLYTGGGDTDLRVWRLPDGSKKFPKYDASSNVAIAGGHTDAIWAIDHHASHTCLLTASADGTCRIWDTSEPEPEHLHTIDPGCGAISAAEFVRSDVEKLVLGHTSGRCGIYEWASGDLVRDLFVSDDLSQITCIRTHHEMPLIVTAHSDKALRVLDLVSGECKHVMTAHRSAVMSIDFDPSGLYLVSGAHDRSVRVWDFVSYTCVDENTTHRLKHDEAINCVRFHRSLPLFATSGADAGIQIFS